MTSSIKQRVVIDTNVFVSGVLFGGIPRQVLDTIKSPHIELLMSQLLANEILSQLQQFHVSDLTYNVIRYALSSHARMVAPKRIARTSRDPKDDMLLAVALAGSAAYLVTGDKDLLVLRTFGSTQIVTPKQYIRIIKKIV